MKFFNRSFAFSVLLLLEVFLLFLLIGCSADAKNTSPFFDKVVTDDDDVATSVKKEREKEEEAKKKLFELDDETWVGNDPYGTPPPKVFFENTICELATTSGRLTLPNVCLTAITPSVNIQGSFDTVDLFDARRGIHGLKPYSMAWVTEPFESISAPTFEVSITGVVEQDAYYSFIRADMDASFPIDTTYDWGQVKYVNDPADEARFARNVFISTDENSPTVFNLLPAKNGRDAIDVACYAVHGDFNDAKLVCSFSGSNIASSPNDAEAITKELLAEAKKSGITVTGKTAGDEERAVQVARYFLPIKLIKSNTKVAYDALQAKFTTFITEADADADNSDNYCYKQQGVELFIEGKSLTPGGKYCGSTTTGSTVYSFFAHVGLRYYYPWQRSKPIYISAVTPKITKNPISADGMQINGDENNGYAIKITRAYPNLNVLKFDATIEVDASVSTSVNSYRYAWFRTDFNILASLPYNKELENARSGVDGKRRIAEAKQKDGGAIGRNAILQSLESFLGIENGAIPFEVTTPQPNVLSGVDPSPFSLEPLPGVSIMCNVAAAADSNVSLACNYHGKNQSGPFYNIRIVDAAREIRPGSVVGGEISEPIKLAVMIFPVEAAYQCYKDKIVELRDRFNSNNNTPVTITVVADYMKSCGGRAKPFELRAGMKYY